MRKIAYTTREQSKILLDLGLPANSADMFYQNGLSTPKVIPEDRQYSEYTDEIKQDWYWVFVPCWSIGHLLVLLLKYCVVGCEINLRRGIYSADYVLRISENILKYHFHFSKLTYDLHQEYESIKKLQD